MAQIEQQGKPTIAEWQGLIHNLRKIGTEWKGACPACGAGDDRFWIKDDLTFSCRHGCTFEQIMRAINRWNDTPPAGEIVTLTDAWKYQNTKGESVTVTRQRGKGTPCRRHPKGIKGPYLPLDLDKLDKSKPIVIVEGERCRDAVLKNTTYQATSWISGAKNWDKTDWTPLAGCHCILWRDYDEDGKRAMRGLMGGLHGMGCRISIVKIPEGKPVKWDAADAEPGEAQAMLDDPFNLTESQIAKVIEDGQAAELVEIGDESESRADVETITAAQITPKAVDWLIPGWLAAGNLTLLAGQAGMGKTTLALGLAAAVSRGGKWGNGLPVESGEVVMWCGEDDLEHTIAPNLIASKADLNRIHFPAAVKTASGPREFNPETDMPGIAARMEQLDNPKLLVIDPVLSLVSSVKDNYKATEIRKALQPVQKLATERGIAVVGLTHFLKRHNSQGSDTQDQVIGSQAWVAVARMVWAVGKTEAGKALFRVKSNLGMTEGGFTYQINGYSQGNGIEGKVASFGNDVVEGEADDAFAVKASRSAPAKDQAKEWLQGYLGNNPDGDTWEHLLEAAAAEEGISKSALLKARQDLKKRGAIRDERTGFGKATKSVWKAGGHSQS